MNDKSDCDLTRQLVKVLTKHQNGKLVVKMHIGLYDVCFFLQILGYDKNLDDKLPPFHSCKTIKNVSSILGEETIEHLEKGHRLERIDKLFDGEFT